MYKIGDCFNCSGNICTESKAQKNYCCPYSDPKKCPYYIPITGEMLEQFNKNGVMCIPAPAHFKIGGTEQC